MQFLTPWTIALAAGLAVPPLVALYFLKLKRQTYAISSTLLWKKAIEDLHVNAPFQRLRSSLLFWLQLLILILAAVALGQPLLARARQHHDTLILMIDQSASMAVAEENGETRLDAAKRQAKRVIDSMNERSRAMVIAFCDRATLVSSFDTDREALKRRIDTIEQTDSSTTLTEAVTLAEAYSQNLIIGGATEGTDVAPSSAAPPASVMLFTDGRIDDADTVSPQRLDLSSMEVVLVGKRNDNVGIIAMDARRNYEHPDSLQVFATIRNFSDTPMSFDAALYINNRHVDVQEVRLAPGLVATEPTGDATDSTTKDQPAAPATSEAVQDAETEAAPPGSVASVAFDEIEYPESGLAEVRLSVEDALAPDNHSWTVIPPPRRVNVLLVTAGNHLLTKAVTHLNITVSTMTPDEYEKAPDDDLIAAGRSKFDAVILDAHSTARLPTGNYMFWGSTPRIDGVEELDWTDSDPIIDWKDSHPVLRHTNVGSMNVYSWKRIKLPQEAARLIEGEAENSTPLAYLTRGGSRFLIVAFPIYVTDAESGEPTLNTDWVLRWDFVTFLYDSVQFLASSTAVSTTGALRPGEPKTVTIPPRTEQVTVSRPDGQRDVIPAAGDSVTYARTRRVGLYAFDPAADADKTVAVNLFSPAESRIAPRGVVMIGLAPLTTARAENLVSEPLWPWLLLAILGFVVFEWVVYNKRVFV